MQLRQIAENLIECGAPMYLCNDLLRRIEELALAYLAARGRAGRRGRKPSRSLVAELEIVVGETLRDPFADILALTPEERIALFT